MQRYYTVTPRRISSSISIVISRIACNAVPSIRQLLIADSKTDIICRRLQLCKRKNIQGCIKCNGSNNRITIFATFGKRSEFTVAPDPNIDIALAETVAFGNYRHCRHEGKSKVEEDYTVAAVLHSLQRVCIYTRLCISLAVPVKSCGIDGLVVYMNKHIRVVPRFGVRRVVTYIATT